MKASEVNGKLGETRSVLHSTYLLHTPDAFVAAPFAGLERGVATVHASPQLGANFLMYTASLEGGGLLHTADEQCFAWVLEGEVSFEVEGRPHLLRQGWYGYAPHGARVHATSAARLLVFEKKYEGVDGMMQPDGFVGHESAIKGVPLDGDEGLIVRPLLPAGEAFDFAVNTMTYAPGAALAQVEVHVMEHGLLMLEGGGSYRLNADFHDVERGDCIWMAPYCPQWFQASVDGSAKYLIYKDWNRRPAL